MGDRWVRIRPDDGRSVVRWSVSRWPVSGWLARLWGAAALAALCLGVLAGAHAFPSVGPAAAIGSVGGGGPARHALLGREPSGRAADGGLVLASGEGSGEEPVLSVPGPQTVEEESLLEFVVSATDSGLGALTFGLTASPVGASIDPQSGVFRWRPNLAQAGVYDVEVTVVDADGFRDSAVVRITVVDVTPPVLEDPGPKTFREGQAVSFALSASDSGGDVLSYGAVGLPPGITVDSVTGLVSGTLALGTAGSYSVTYSARDNAHTVTVAGVIVVEGSNLAPTAVDDSRVTDEDTRLTFPTSDLTFNDTDPNPEDVLSVAAVSPRPETHGTVELLGDEVVYTPAPEFHGVAAFDYTVSDGRGGTDVGLVTVIVNSVNDPPVLASIGPKPAAVGTALRFTVAATDADSGDVLTYGVAEPLPGGASFDPAARVFSWTPGPADVGTHTVRFVVTDLLGASDHEDVAITVAGANRPPVAVDDSFSTPRDTPLWMPLAQLLAQDSDPDGDALGGFTVTLPPAPHGAFEVREDGVLFTPAPGYTGPESFTYRVSDGRGGTSNAATVTILVTPVNRAPVLEPIGPKSVAEGETLSFQLSATDADAGDALSFSAAAAPSGVWPAGASFDPSTRTFTWTPDYTQAGIYTARFTVTDSQGETDHEDVPITVTNTNRRPELASPGDRSFVEGEAVSVALSAADPDGDPLIYSASGLPGGLSVDAASGLVAGTVAFGDAGAHAVTFRVSDGELACEVVAVFTVTQVVNHPPVARDDARTVLEDGTALFGAAELLANDTDPEGEPLSLVAVAAGPDSHGAVDLEGASVTYQPPADWHGTDSFTYTVRDARGATATARVTVTVLAVNDLPVARDDAYASPRDTPLEIAFAGLLANDTDVDGDTLTFGGLLLDPGDLHGTVSASHTSSSVRVVPDPGYTGPLSFRYQVSDGKGGSAQARVTVTFTGANTAPVLGAIGALFTAEGAALSLQLSATDADPGDTLTFSASGLPEGASLDPATGAFAWTPDYASAGVRAVTFRVTDAAGASDSEAVTITVTNTNRPPQAAGDLAQTPEDTPLVLSTAGLLANDVDPDGEALVVVSAAETAHGSVVLEGGSVTYVPSPDYHGPDSFAYTVRDPSGATALGTVSVTVTPVNDPPVLVSPGDRSLVRGAAVDLRLSASDPDNDSLVYSAHGLPPGLSLDPITGAVTGAVSDTAEGSYPVTFVVSDGLLSHSVQVVFTVTLTNRPPVADAPLVTTAEDTPVSITLNAADPDGDTLTFTLLTPPLHGTLSAVSGSGVTYTPAPNYHGPDAFRFAVTDGTAQAQGEVSLVVTPVNDAPTLTVMAGGAVAEGQPWSAHAAASDADGDVVTVTVGPLPPGAEWDPGTGTLSWRPSHGQAGAYEVRFVADDGHGGVTERLLSVTVSGTNRPPTAGDLTLRTAVGALVEAALPGVDEDGDPLTYEMASPPLHGAASVSAAGSVAYRPQADFRGTDSFTYRVTDGFGAAEGRVEVIVGEANRPPAVQVVGPAPTTIEEGALLVLRVSAEDPEGDAVALRCVEAPKSAAFDALTGVLEWRPDSSQLGVRDLVFEAHDPQGAAGTLTVRIEVLARDDAPEALPELLETPEDCELRIPRRSFEQTGADGASRTLSAVAAAEETHGTVEIQGSEVVYRPEPDYYGEASFLYTITLGGGGSRSGVARVRVTAVPDAPRVEPETTEWRLVEGEVGTLRVRAWDPDGGPVVLRYLEAPGGPSLEGDLLRWKPTRAQVGLHVLVLEAEDDTGATGTAAVQALVAAAPANRPPRAAPILLRVPLGHGPAQVELKGTDDDGSALAYRLVTAPREGEVALVGDRLAEVRPPAAPSPFEGVLGFTYDVSDGDLASAPAPVYVVYGEAPSDPGCRLRVATQEGAPGALVSLRVTGEGLEPLRDAALFLRAVRVYGVALEILSVEAGSGLEGADCWIHRQGDTAAFAAAGAASGVDLGEVALVRCRVPASARPGSLLPLELELGAVTLEAAPEEPREVFPERVSGGVRVVEQTVLAGDVNQDGALDVRDVILAVRLLLGLPAPDASPGAADINGDGRVDISDVMALLASLLRRGP